MVYGLWFRVMTCSASRVGDSKMAKDAAVSRVATPCQVTDLVR
jgi:hypothetical protein